jgi:CHAT domain-containing protein
LADKHTAIIEWHITNDSLLTFIIFPEHKHIFPHPPSNFKVLQSSSEKLQEIYNFINEYTQEYLYNQNSWNYKFTKYLDILAELLEINKILSYISNDCNQLILVPHLFLRLFPLHALPVNSKNRFGSCLLERFKRGIRYIASCQLQQQIEKRKNVEFNNIFAFQNPSGDLEYANLEVNAIKADFQSSQIYVQAQAKKEAINNDRLRDFHCIHFACHGRFSFEGGVDSTILLADEKLSLWEIFDLQLHKCRLVTLSACETGLTDVQYSRMYGVDDCYGLHSSFLIAGASSVVSSLWVVNDISTAFLMIRFYQNLHTGLSVALALNTAQIWLRDITTAQLHKWACQLKLTAEFKQHINQTLDWFDDHEKPFQNPLYWAAFYAIGQ